MKRFLFGFVVILISCTEHSTIDYSYIEGYWEIEEVRFSNGAVKQYQINETIDYIRLNDSFSGFRKKLKPGINGTYYTSEDAEALKLRVEDDSLRLYYSTPYASWKETVLEADSAKLMVVNENKIVYLYKRYRPIQLDAE